MQSLEFRAPVRGSTGEPCDPLAQGHSLEDLRRVVRSALLPEGGADGGDGFLEVVAVDSQQGGKAVLVRAGASGVARLQELRDRVLSGEFDAAAARALGPGAQWSLCADRTEFAEQYEERARELVELTPHQHEKLQECAEGGDGGDVHLRAPAGAGKTFVALHRVLDTLRSQPSARVLFVARNAALACFAASWLGRRVRSAAQQRELLGRLLVLHEPFERGVRAVAVRGRRVELQAAGNPAAGPAYALVVVDEAHHLYADPAARSLVEGLVQGRVAAHSARRLLLSDISQSLGRGVAYPEGLREVVLSEVVRCSKRIVAGAMAFQLGGEEKLLTKCHHEATGPPLQSFLFDLPEPQADGSGFFQAYALHIVRALEHVVAAFPGLSLHNRVALIVPNSEFLEGLRSTLQSALAKNFPERRLQLVDAATASSDLGPEAEGTDGGDAAGAADPAASGGGPSAGDQEMGARAGPEVPEEWLVYDSVHQVDGLERLIVVGVGLDSAIRSEDVGAGSFGERAGSAALEARSMLYRAVTRAHLMFLVVNEFLRGGWLEFLGSVRLREDEAFDSSAELARSEAQAVEGFVMAELTSAVAMAARERSFELDNGAASALASDVAKARERGEALEPALDTVLRMWRSASELVLAAFEASAQQLTMALPDAPALAELLAPATLDCYRGEVANVGASALEALKRHRSQELRAQADAALKAAAAAAAARAVEGGGAAGGEAVVDPGALAELRMRVVYAAERGEGMEAAAVAAVQEWLQAQAQVAEALRTALEQRGGTAAGASFEKVLRSATVAVACHGEAPVQAIKSAILKLDKERTGAELAAALERAAAAETEAHSPPCCRAGGRVRVFGLRSKPELNGLEGTAKSFFVAMRRWSVQLDGKRKPIAVRPEHLEPLQGPAAPTPLSEAQEPLKAVAAAAVESGVSAEDAITLAVLRWRTVEAQVASALEVAAADRQLQPSEGALAGMVRSVTEKVWQGDPAGSGNDDDDAEDTEEQEPPIGAAVAAALADWEQRERLQQREAAHIASALEAAASSQRLLLTDAALAALQRRVAAALRRGEELDTAVAAALREYHRQVVRKQVQQTVWDPSGNLTRKVTGVVRFMPFKHKTSDRFDLALLACVFAVLPFRQLGELARVSKRWRSVANDPSWKPELVAYAWGDAHVTGLSRVCPRPALLEFSLAKRIVRIACADAATLALTEEGFVWFWGRSWLPGQVPDQPYPSLVHELRDVVSLAVSPAGYFHGRERRQGFSCAAVTREGDLYTWGVGHCGQLLQRERELPVPRLVTGRWDEWQPSRERALFVACGLDFLALCVHRTDPGPMPLPEGGDAAGPATCGSSSLPPGVGTTAVLSCGSFNQRRGWPHELHEWPELRGVALRQLAAGAFHCCALTTRGDLYTFGDEYGQDSSNGNLLGRGTPGEEPAPGLKAALAFVMPPNRVEADGLGPVAEVSCSTYTTAAIAVDGRVFTWGDCDGNALGHANANCHTPTWLTALRWQRVVHGSLAYTNAAVATAEGRVFVWGGNYWGGGIAEGRASVGPSEVKWGGVPSCYRCASVALAHRHGYLMFRKQP